MGDDHVGATVARHVRDLDRLGDVGARVGDGGGERAARGLREHREPGRRPVAAVRGDDVGPAVARDVTHADAVGERAARHGGRGRGREPATGELGEHLDVGHEALAGHHDDVVAAVAAHVGRLEVVLAVVR